MNTKRAIEIFTAGCPLCEEAVATVRRVACDITVLDVADEDGARRAADLGVRSVPTVVVDGQVADCCRSGGVTEEGLHEEGLHAAGVGQTA